MSGGAFPTQAAHSATAAVTHTTGSFTPRAQSRMLIFGMATRTGGVTPNSPVVTSSGLSVASLSAEVGSTDVANPALRLNAYLSANSGASPASQTLTCASASAALCGVAAMNVYNDEITGNLVRFTTHEEAAGDPAVTWPTTPPNWFNHCYVHQFHAGGNTITEAPGYAIMAQATVVTARQSCMARDSVQTPLGPSAFTSTNTKALLLALEMEADLTAPVSPAIMALNSAATFTVTQTNRNPPANCRMIVIARANRSGGTAIPSKPTISSVAATGTNPTWTEIVNRHSSNVTTQDMWSVAWISNDVGASPPTGVDITVAVPGSPANTQISLHGMGVHANTTDGTIRQTQTSEDLANGDPSLTFGTAFLSNSLVIADAMLLGSNNPVTASTGWRTQRAATIQSGFRWITAYAKKAEGSTTVAVTSTNTRSIMIGFELNPPSALTQYTLTADAGSYAYGGQASGTLYGPRLDAEAGSYAYGGQAAITAYGFRLVADAGSYAYAGLDTALRATRALTADAGAYAYDGMAAGLLTSRSLIADAGAYAYAGIATLLQATGFDEFADGAGAAPDGWTPQWDTGGVAWSEDAGGFARAAVSATDNHLLSWDELAGNPADMELLCEFETASSPGSQRLGLVLRGSGSNTAESGYVLVVK